MLIVKEISVRIEVQLYYYLPSLNVSSVRLIAMPIMTDFLGNKSHLSISLLHYIFFPQRQIIFNAFQRGSWKTLLAFSYKGECHVLISITYYIFFKKSIFYDSHSCNPAISWMWIRVFVIFIVDFLLFRYKRTKTLKFSYHLSIGTQIIGILKKLSNWVHLQSFYDGLAKISIRLYNKIYISITPCYPLDILWDLCQPYVQQIFFQPH